MTTDDIIVLVALAVLYIYLVFFKPRRKDDE